MTAPAAGRSRWRELLARQRDAAHPKRMAISFVILTAIIEPIVYFLIWPHLPPGTMTDTARGAQFDTMILVMMAAPITVGVVLYLLYAAAVWHHPKHEPLVDGPPIRSHFMVQTLWIGLTSIIVFGAFVFGTYELVVPAGAGGGEGPSPIWTPATQKILPIQVIGQQWMWTYRYPTYGGFETTSLVIPDHTQIAFHVTSLDVVHEFWAYELGVKADANPQVDNVAFTKPAELGKFVVRCNELCGIWHGAMFNYGTVVTPTAFDHWAKSTEAKQAKATKLLPKFAWTYVPSANGAGGGYYPEQDVIPDQELYQNNSPGPEGRLPALNEKQNDRNVKK